MDSKSLNRGTSIGGLKERLPNGKRSQWGQEKCLITIIITFIIVGFELLDFSSICPYCDLLGPYYYFS